MNKRNKIEWWNQLDEDYDPEERMAKLRLHKPVPSSQVGEPEGQQVELAALMAEDGRSDEYNFTYQASRHEGQWLMDSLRSFYAQRWIDDVLRVVKGGKEASVYLCQGSSNVDNALLAAKVYRPRAFRNLKNDSLYREGREVLDAEGHEILDGRMQRAMRNHTDYGLQLLHTSWLEHEFTAMKKLFSAGADVPEPHASDQNAILMDYVGDATLGAPTLNSVRLEPEEAVPLFERVVRNIEIMLSNEMVHGDLSAYNILYWQEAITLIDFPQVIYPHQNRNAFQIFARDVLRVCEYFISQGVQVSPRRLATDLWTAYRFRVEPEVPLHLFDEEDDKEIAYWKSIYSKNG